MLASFLALWAILATTAVDATVYLCAGMDEVRQHCCCGGDAEDAAPTVRDLAHDGCCSIAHLDQQERATTTPDAPAITPNASALRAIAAPPPPVTPAVRFTYARGPPSSGPPLFIEHRALLI